MDFVVLKALKSLLSLKLMYFWDVWYVYTLEHREQILQTVIWF